MMKIKTKKREMTANTGHFVMRDNRCAAVSTAGQEIGVVLNNDYYMDIDSILTTPISHQEAKQYGKLLRLSLPSKKMLRLLADNQETVNNSLLSIGRGDCLILGNVADDFWTSRSNLSEKDKRKVLFIRPVVRKHN